MVQLLVLGGNSASGGVDWFSRWLVCGARGGHGGPPLQAPRNLSRTPQDASPAFIGLGSNLGRREANLVEAIERIKSLGLAVVRHSSIYETEPVGYAAQPWFLNQVIELGPPATDPLKPRSDLPSPARLLALLLQIERDMGRKRSIPGGPRVIDLDLLLYGDLVIDESLEGPEGMIDTGGGAGKSRSEDSADAIDTSWAANRVIVPHPRLHLRRFVLLPLCEIDASIMHPVLGKTCGQLLANLESREVLPRINTNHTNEDR